MRLSYGYVKAMATGFVVCKLLVIGLLQANHSFASADNGPIAMPAPQNNFTVSRDVAIEMRDGIQLLADIYRPSVPADKLPVVVIRTPYNKARKDPEQKWAEFWARRGYIVVLQDVRGKFKSAGVFSVMGSDGADGFDTIEWAARQQWSTGSVGTFGCSYLGINQVITSALRPPALRAMIAMAPGGAAGALNQRYRFFGVLNGGARELAASLHWFPSAGKKHPHIANAKDNAIVAVQKQPDLSKDSWHLPLSSLIDELGFTDTDWRDFMLREPGDQWWKPFNYIDDNARPNVPVLWVNSWYDYSITETLALRTHFLRHSLSDTARANQPIIISPAEHCQSELLGADATIQGRNMGDPRFDYWGAYLAWFDYWLKQSDRKPDVKPVNYFLMGANQWRYADRWPPFPAEPEQTTLYLAGGSANSRFGNGQLLHSAPQNGGMDSFLYDPATPVPSVAGPFCCKGFPSNGARNAYDHRGVEQRQDVLVYTTQPFARPAELSGPVSLILYAASSARDTDFTAKLLDVNRQGEAFALTEGILRARYRDGFTKSRLMTPGQVYRLEVQLGETSHLFKTGHRLRLEVSSSNFPRFDRNTNTGRNIAADTGFQTADNQVYFGSGKASHLRLPFITKPVTKKPAIATPTSMAE